MAERKTKNVKCKSAMPSSKFLILTFSFTFLLLPFAFLIGCQNRTLHKESRIAMGTFVEVVSPDKDAAKLVFDEMGRIEDLLSKYKNESEISRLNKNVALVVSPDTLYVIKEAKKIWMVTAGIFDITIGTLMDIWGFTDRDYKVPTESQIKEALRLVGSDKILIDEDKRQINFGLEGMKIDLGGIAKGYAVDCAIKKLKKAGVKSCLVNAGGDIYCLGDKFGKPWNVAIQNPRGKGVIDCFKLKDKAVATSGDYEQYFINEHKRYSHIFNPKTGYPVDPGVISVTVIASNCLTADALATSIFVLGKQKGEELAKRFANVEVRIIEE